MNYSTTGQCKQSPLKETIYSRHAGQLLKARKDTGTYWNFNKHRAI